MMSVNKQFIEDNYKLVQYVATKVGTRLTPEEREDLVNDTVIKLLQSDVEVRQDEASAYINRVMKNCLINNMRDGQVDAMYYTESLDAPVDKDEPDGMTMHEIVPDKDVSNFAAKHEKEFKRLCQGLPYMQGRLMYMRYLLGMSPTEIADELCMENNAVRTTLKRAKKNAFKET